MEKILPLFPLNLVVYPNEHLNLHIFEPRYKQMIQDCQQNQSNFGIPAFIDNEVSTFGTEVKILKIERQYEDGRMDIKTKGVQVFKILTFDNPLENKLYAGGLIQPIETKEDVSQQIASELIDKITELYQLLQLKIEINIQNFKILSYEVAHRVGLSLEQEYELLCIASEKKRQQFLLQHLKKAIPIVEEMERTKQIIRMNGHFKHFDPLNF